MIRNSPRKQSLLHRTVKLTLLYNGVHQEIYTSYAHLQQREWSNSSNPIFLPIQASFFCQISQPLYDSCSHFYGILQPLLQSGLRYYRRIAPLCTGMILSIFSTLLKKCSNQTTLRIFQWNSYIYIYIIPVESGAIRR